MKAFSELLVRLLYAPQRNTKLRLIEDYLKTAPDPDRGYALAALTGDLSLRHAKPGLIRQLIEERVDGELFRLSYDFVGDLAETVALLWPGSNQAGTAELCLSRVIESLQTDPASRAGDDVAQRFAGWLDRLDQDGRFALLKLVTGGLRVGVSARLAKLAVASYGKIDAAEIEEVWHALEPPYLPLFQWLDGKGPRPDLKTLPVFRPLMLANPIEHSELAALSLADFVVEWKWDGARVQIAAANGDVRLYARGGDDISAGFPDIIEPLAALAELSAVMDGELLVRHGKNDDGHELGGFNDLQKRLNRKTITKTMRQRYPAFIHLYDILMLEDENLRPLPFIERRRHLTELTAKLAERVDGFLDLSPLIEVGSLDELDAMRAACRGDLREGLMLKRKSSAYVAGRPRGAWYKYKRDPLNLDCVMMYAQRGHGRRSSLYSDYTFGAWTKDEAGSEKLVPVGKAYFGFSDAELTRLDKWVRDNTKDRFGPVREVHPGLVLEIGFDSVHHSQRHKSGVAMRFPRILRIRWDKRTEEADRLETLKTMIER